MLKKLLNVRRIFFVLGILLSFSSWFLFSDNQFSLSGLTLIIVGLGFIWFTLEKKSEPVAKRNKVWYVLLLLALFVGVFFRFYRLDDLPATMNADILSKIEEIEKMRQGNLMIYSPIASGRETLFMYILSLVSFFRPLNFLAFKIATAAFGSLTVVSLFLALSELEEGVFPAFFASLFLAFGRWHVTISRMGYRLITAPLVTSLFLIYFFRAFQKQNYHPRDYFLAGLWFGLGFYTYPNFQFMIPAVILTLMYLVIVSPAIVRRAMRGIVLFSLISFIVILPLLKFIVYHPKEFFYRGLTRFTSEEVPIAQNPLPIFLNNVSKSLLMFTYAGENERATNVSGSPHLDPITSLFFLCGIAWSLLTIKKKKIRIILLIGLACTWFSQTLSLAFPAEIPNGRRTIIASLFAYSLAGIGLWEMTKMSLKLVPSQKIIAVFLAILFILALEKNYNLYFHVYPEGLPYHNFPFQKVITTEIKEGDRNNDYYISTIGYWHDENFVRKELGTDVYALKKLSLTTDIIPKEDRKQIFYFFPDQIDLEQKIREIYPRVKKTEYKDTFDRIELVKLVYSPT